jgi:tRNA pseudouridine13 synthase
MNGIPHPLLTERIPGIGGGIKTSCEDFVVEEVALYEACGEGEHIYFGLEKTDLSTLELLERLSRKLGRDFRDFGFAGMKDRKGVTRQVISISGVTPDDVLALDLPRVKILWARRHTNKLRVGHLRGNRFTVRVRGVQKVDEERVAAVLSVIAEKGLANYFGPQRFGTRGDSQWVGRSLLLHDDEAVVRRILGRPSPVEGNPDIVAARYLFLQHRWSEALDRFPRSYREERKLLTYLLRHGENYRGVRRQLRREVLKLYLTAYQAYLFNQVLERRLELTGGDLQRLYPGDLAYLHRNGAVFRIDDVDAANGRAGTFEISPSGPMFGKKMLLPGSGLESEIEEGVLAGDRVTHKDFHQLQQWCHLDGGRRALRVKPEDVDWRFEGRDLLIKFFLPKGSYATTLLRELLKNETVLPGFWDR